MSKNSVHSPFAELLFKALEAGDADYTNDGITTVTELNIKCTKIANLKKAKIGKP